MLKTQISACKTIFKEKVIGLFGLLFSALQISPSYNPIRETFLNMLE
jgi:hypothetical protein